MKRRKKTTAKAAPVQVQTAAPPAPAPTRAADHQTIGALCVSGPATIGGSAGIVGSAGP